jgi:hypothetical protein
VRSSPDTYRIASNLPKSMSILSGEVELVLTFWPDLLTRLPANDNGTDTEGA